MSLVVLCGIPKTAGDQVDRHWRDLANTVETLCGGGSWASVGLIRLYGAHAGDINGFQLVEERNFTDAESASAAPFTRWLLRAVCKFSS